MHSEYANRPEALEINHLGNGDCEITLRENISEHIRVSPDGEETTAYTADEYILTVPDREGLGESVQASLTDWLETARSKEFERLSEEVRVKRNGLLTSCDWTQTADAPVTEATAEQLRQYRQQLRDITTQDGFPYNVQWPDEPNM